MTTVFADTGYWISYLDPRDTHASAVGAYLSITDFRRIVTTQMVLDEVLAAMSRRGPGLRTAAASLALSLDDLEQVEVIPQTDTQFRAALARYASRSDQTWSLTDCASFLVMEDRGMTEALAYDRDFEQAGFVALLRDEPT